MEVDLFSAISDKNISPDLWSVPQNKTNLASLKWNSFQRCTSNMSFVGELSETNYYPAEKSTIKLNLKSNIRFDCGKDVAQIHHLPSGARLPIRSVKSWESWHKIGSSTTGHRRCQRLYRRADNEIENWSSWYIR